MIDIKILRENPQKIEISSLNKGVTIDTAHILEIDAKYRELSLDVQNLREQRNKFSKLAATPNPIERAKAI